MSQENNQILKNTNAELLDQFNASVMFDKELYAQDIKGSIAHSKMLALQGIISLEDQEKIETGLLRIKAEIESGEFEWKIEHEEIRGTRESISNHPELESVALKCPNCKRIFAMTFKKKKKRRRRSRQVQTALPTT